MVIGVAVTLLNNGKVATNEDTTGYYTSIARNGSGFVLRHGQVGRNAHHAQTFDTEEDLITYCIEEDIVSGWNVT